MDVLRIKRILSEHLFTYSYYGWYWRDYGLSQNIFVSLAGRYPWATINSYYAVLFHEKFVPDHVYLVCEQDYESSVPLIHHCLDQINSSFGIDCSIEDVLVPTAEFSVSIHRFQQLVKQFVESKDSVALDITGGRRTLIAASLLTMKRTVATHVFYLAVTEEGKRDIPYLMKPLKSMQMKDFLGDS